MFSISYVVFFKNIENKNSLKNIIKTLLKQINNEDEILIIKEFNGFDKEFDNIKDNKIRKYKFLLDSDKSAKRNFVTKRCTKDYIFLLQNNEEIDSRILGGYLTQLIDLNPKVELFYFNINIEDSYKTDIRLYKRSDNLTWSDPSTPHITGYKKEGKLPISIYTKYNIKPIEKTIYQKYSYELEHVEIEGKYKFEYAHWKHPYCKKKKFKCELIDELKNLITGGDIVIDIGAFTGDTPVIYGLITQKEGKIIAFEPNPYAYQILEVNASLNPDLNIIPVNRGIAETEGEFIFHYSDDNFCNGGFASKTEYGIGVTGHKVPLKVKCVNLKKWVDENLTIEEKNKISLIKLDTEGYDRFILASMKELLKEIRPIITTEVYTGLTQHEIEKQLKVIFELDYIPFRISQYKKNIDLDIYNLTDPLNISDCASLKKEVWSGEDILCIPKEKYRKNKHV